MSAQPELAAFSPSMDAVFAYALEPTGPDSVHAVTRKGELIVGGRRTTAFTGKERSVRARMRESFPNAVEISAPRLVQSRAQAEKRRVSAPVAALPGMRAVFAPKSPPKAPYRLYGDPMDGVHPLFRPLLGVWQPITSHDYTEGE